MATRYGTDRIDAQWQAKSPGWRPKEYGGEREMLYDILDGQEDIECLLACRWGDSRSWEWVWRMVVGDSKMQEIITRGLTMMASPWQPADESFS